MLKNGLMVNDGKKWLYNGMLIDLNTAHLGLHTKREVLPELWGSKCPQNKPSASRVVNNQVRGSLWGYLFLPHKE